MKRATKHCPLFVFMLNCIIKAMNTLIIFIKNPELGKVKTRIAATAGEERAFQIYLELLRHTREVTLSVDAQRLLFYSDFVDETDHWSSTDFQKLVQQGMDLGERMRQSFEVAFSQGASKAVIIGSDCAVLTGGIVEAAFRNLDDYPFVIGPSTDGGYYLLGMNAYFPSVFENIEWSTETVLSDSLKKIVELGKNYFLLPELTDIDHEEDWEKYGWRI